jgi:hypothetical protein
MPDRDELLVLALSRDPPFLNEHLEAFPGFLDIFIRLLVSKLPENRPLNWVYFLRELTEMGDRYLQWQASIELIDAFIKPDRRRTFRDALLRARHPSKKPESGERPNEAVLAGLQGYEAETALLIDEEGIPEPSWMKAEPSNMQTQTEENKLPNGQADPRQARAHANDAR